MEQEVRKEFILDTQQAYRESRDVSKEERQYLTVLLREMEKIDNLDDKVDCLLMNGVRYVGEGSYWEMLEQIFPQYVHEVATLSDMNEARKFDKEKWIKCTK